MKTKLGLLQEGQVDLTFKEQCNPHINTRKIKRWNKNVDRIQYHFKMFKSILENWDQRGTSLM